MNLAFERANARGVRSVRHELDELLSRAHRRAAKRGSVGPVGRRIPGHVDDLGIVGRPDGDHVVAPIDVEHDIFLVVAPVRLNVGDAVIAVDDLAVVTKLDGRRSAAAIGKLALADLASECGRGKKGGEDKSGQYVHFFSLPTDGFWNY